MLSMRRVNSLSSSVVTVMTSQLATAQSARRAGGYDGLGVRGADMLLVIKAERA